MKCSCKKDSSLCSVHSTSPYFLGCLPCGTLSEFDVQQSPVSESLSLKMGVLPQQSHITKPLTDQSYPEVGSAKSGVAQKGAGQNTVSTLGQPSIQYSNSSAHTTCNRTSGKPMGGLVRSLGGRQDSAFPYPQPDHSQSIAHIAFHNADSYFGGLLTAAYGSHSKIHHAQLMGMAPLRIPLPLDLTEEPIFVNAKQYHAILRRRQYRAKLEAQNKLNKNRKPYLHESRHLHALKRVRGSGGRFLNTKKLQESKLTSANQRLDVSGCARLNQPRVHQVENCRDGASTTTCSDLTSASNSDDIFQQQQESDFRFCGGYPSHTMPGYSGDINGDENQHRLSVFM